MCRTSSARSCPARRGRNSSISGPRRLGEVLAAPATWTLRDYHSPNLIWLPEREGLQRVGMIDFQDAVLGAPAYDVASLLQDARVTVPPDLELKLIGLYARERKGADPGLRRVGLRPGLRDHGRPARHQDPRHFRPPRPARRQAALPASTCRGSKPISSATSPIRPWRSSRSGMRITCRGSSRMAMKSLPNPEPALDPDPFARAPQSHRPRCRIGQAHAADHRHDAEAPREGGGPEPDRFRPRQAARGGHGERGGERAPLRRHARSASAHPRDAAHRHLG